MTGIAGPRLRGVFAVAVILVVVGSSLAVFAHGSNPASSLARIPAVVSGPATSVTYEWSDVSTMSPSAPSPRAAVQAAYSPALGKVVLFGGYDPSVSPDGDTWGFSASHWTEISASGGPPGRWGGEMVYDAADGYLLLFGGRNVTQFFNDTWSYSATGWHQIVTSDAPSPRSNSGLAYDPSDGDVILFGGGMGSVPAGSGGPTVYYNDTWTYRAGVWTNVTSTAGLPPSPRWTGGMSYDASSGSVVLEGGNGGTSCVAYNDTWEYSGGRWTQLSPAEAPPPSFLGGTVLDTQTNSTLLFLGLTYQPFCTDSFSSQVWMFSGGDWSLSVPNTTSSPQGRASPLWVDDPADHGELLFGGDASGTYFSDTWILVAVPPLVMGPDISSSRLSADVGQVTTFTGGAVSGGQLPYTYTWQGLPTGCSGNTTAVVDCTFTAPAHLEISLVVSDPADQTNTSAVLGYVVYADPTFTSYPAANPDPVSVGSSVTFSANVSGGSGGFAFVWQGLPPGCESIDAPSVTCTPTEKGTFYVDLEMNDSNGVNATSPTWPEVVLPSSAPSNSSSQAVSFFTSPYFLVGVIAILVAAVVAAVVWRRRTPPASSVPPSSGPPPAPPPGS